ncbi:MAG: GNAT family N-acetyltransferase [Ruminococcaceae bacterium]|nr:GNAT family N-acetyltransferase [Oscillospiraceae bacterium]
MEFLTYKRLENENLLKSVYELVVLGDQEFIPPLSARSSTTQQTLAGAQGNGIDAYFEEMKKQSFVLAFEQDKVVGFMSFRENYENPHLPAGENLYASTCVVHPDFRGRGMMRSFYEAMIKAFHTRPIYTRTWHENIGHLKVLDRLGFTLLETIENDRGPGIHTVYFGRQPK